MAEWCASKLCFLSKPRRKMHFPGHLTFCSFSPYCISVISCASRLSKSFLCLCLVACRGPIFSSSVDSFHYLVPFSIVLSCSHRYRDFPSDTHEFSVAFTRSALLVPSTLSSCKKCPFLGSSTRQLNHASGSHFSCQPLSR